MEDEEASLHFLCYCPAFVGVQATHLGASRVKAKDVLKYIGLGLHKDIGRRAS